MKKGLRFSVAIAAGLALVPWVAACAESTPAVSGALLADYSQIHEALSADSVAGVAAAAAALGSHARAAAVPAESKPAYEKVAVAAEAMKGDDIEALREQMNALSRALAAVVDTAGGKEAGLFYCSMFDGYWLQKSGDSELRNPYYGKSMLTCGEKVEGVAAE
jgi:hypothetical protein